MHTPRFLFLLVTVFFFSCNGSKKNSTTPLTSFHHEIRKNIIAENGAVVSAHTLASQAGVAIMKKGGNAFDAAIATQFALAVVYPNAGNLGGGGFLVGRKKDGDLVSIDYREKAPGKAHRDMYVDADGTARTDKSQFGHLASGVPGTVSGLFATMKYARLSITDLLEPAITLAEQGFALSEREAKALNNLQPELKKYNTVMPAFVKEGGWKAGDVLVQTDLANTLKRIRDNGEAGFYEGETARLIVEEMKRGGGIISLEDLAAYKAKPRKPHVFSYKGYRIVGMPMPSSGGLLIHQMMKMIEERDISKMGFHSLQAVQLMTEVEKRAFADRGEYMGDADHFRVPVSMLTNEIYLQDKMRNYDPGKATPREEIKPGFLQRTESEETTHLSVIDKEGNAVAVTTTLNNSYGSRTVVGGAGFFLNDEMDDFSIKPGVPNMYGAIGGEANAIKPGKRMLSSMTPTIVLKDDKPYLVIGTPGGTTIPTQVFQTLVNILEFNLPVTDAVNKPKFHHQWIPDTLFIEKGFPEDIRAGLGKMGYAIQQRSAIGRTEVIKVLPNGKFEAVADKRGEDSAEGY
jgi:gamma-glutamyltranspeptidase/glutathione hydrolase